jgi:hypothetical protein
VDREDTQMLHVAVSGAVFRLLPARVQSAVGQVQISQGRKSAAKTDAETEEGRSWKRRHRPSVGAAGARFNGAPRKRSARTFRLRPLPATRWDWRGRSGRQSGYGTPRAFGKMSDGRCHAAPCGFRVSGGCQPEAQ